MAKKSLRKLILYSNIDDATDSTVCREYCRGIFEPQRLKEYTKLQDGVTFLGVGQSNAEIDKEIKKYLKVTLKSVLTYKRCVFNDMLLHGSTYTRVSRTDDSVVLMESGKIVNIDYLVLANETGYIYGRVVKTTCAVFSKNIQLRYIHEVVSYNKPEVIGTISGIKRKCIRTTIGDRTFVMLPANSGEHH